MEPKPKLECAIINGDLDGVQSDFALHDLECNEYDGDGSLLHLAATFGTLEIVKFLVESGAEVNRPGRTFEAPAVTYAAESGFADITRYLVEAGSTLDTSHALKNPLLRAASEGQREVIEYLLKETSIDPHATYRVPSGALINALTKAEQNGHQDVAELLKTHGCRTPREGVDAPIWEPSADRMASQSLEFERHRQIIDYMEARFGLSDPLVQQEVLPPIEGMSVSINTIRPNTEHPYLVLFTNGMSDRSMNTPPGKEVWKYAELVMHLPPDWPARCEADIDPQMEWPMAWLRRMAYHPHLNNTWLGQPAAIVSSADPPEPLGPNTNQTCLLLIPNFANLSEPMKRKDGSPVQFFTVVPLYTEERDYEVNHGMEAFFNRFIKSRVPMTVDVSRPSFA